MRKQAVILRIAIILPEGGNDGIKAVLSYKIRKKTRKGIDAHSMRRQIQPFFERRKK
jgi:hypothetical protein